MKLKNWLPVFSVFGILLLLNILSQRFYARLDLTQEGKYTLTPATKKVLQQLDDIVFIKVYLEGDFPAGFKRLRNSTQDMLDEFRAIAGNNLQYEFIDPLDVESESEKQAIANQLIEKGLVPRRLIENADGYSEKIFFPGAIATYKGREYPIVLLQEQLNKAPETVLNNSTALLEYNLINAIQKLLRKERPHIAFLEGHGELAENYVNDFAGALQTYYELHRLSLPEVLSIDTFKYAAVVIAKPTQPFDEKDKYKLDQYVMRGGKILWLIDPLIADADSLNNTGGSFITADYPLNLDDLLFRYGVRINPNLLQDMQCNPIPVVVGTDKAGNATQQQLFPWLYYPIFTQFNQAHPIGKNMGATMSKFASTLDTIRVQDIKKTVLMSSSQYSRALTNPVNVSLETVKQRPLPEQFNQKNLAVAVALEGEFTSNFKNRLAFSTAEMLDSLNLKFKEKSSPTKMVVIADGDFIKNDYERSSSKTLPLGYYKYTKETFANKDFLLNTIEWLTDDAGVIEARNKEIALRLLDGERSKQERVFWQLFNIMLPLLLTGIAAAAYHFWRKRRYTNNIVR